MASVSEMTPKMRKMLIALGLLVLCSGGYNYYHFVVKRAAEKERLKGQYEREMAADPLFSDVQYETLHGRQTATAPASGEATAPPLDTGPSTEELVRPEVRERVLEQVEAARVEGIERLAILGERYKGALELKMMQERPEEVTLILEIEQPEELSVEEMVAGKKRIWLRAIRSKLHSPSEEKKGAFLFDGKAKAYVSVEAERIRTVVDISVVLRPNDSGQYEASFRVARGSDASGSYPFVEVDGEDFRILLEGRTATEAEALAEQQRLRDAEMAAQMIERIEEEQSQATEIELLE